MRKVSIPKENAVFWLDKNGRWHNEHGPFEHPRVIDYFHSAIRKDADGYFVFQSTTEFEEKVYFPYEDTALFVFDVIMNDEIRLVLNTKRQVPLEPEALFIREDALYVTVEEEPVKFSANALMKFSVLLEGDDEKTTLTLQGREIEIPHFWP